jgi:hypothetical protein
MIIVGKLFTVLLSVIVFTCFFGCTIVGYGIGASVDSYNSKNNPQPVEYENLRIGQEIYVILINQRRITGRYQGIVQTDAGGHLLKVGIAKDEETFPLESVAEIKEFEKKSTGKGIGLLVGFITDVLIVSSIDSIFSIGFNFGGNLEQ